MAAVTCRSGDSGPGCRCLSLEDLNQLFETVWQEAYSGPSELPEHSIDSPTTYLVGGQPGSRKTSMVGVPLAERLRNEGRPFVHYDFDNQRPFHPHAAETFPGTLAAEADPLKSRGRKCVDEDIRSCLVGMHDRARAAGVDIISEGAFENADYIKEHISVPDRAAGRRLHLAYVAAPGYVSWPGVLKRGVDAFVATGEGRLNRHDFHNSTLDQTPTAANICQTRKSSTGFLSTAAAAAPSPTTID